MGLGFGVCSLGFRVRSLKFDLWCFACHLVFGIFCLVFCTLGVHFCDSVLGFVVWCLGFEILEFEILSLEILGVGFGF